MFCSWRAYISVVADTTSAVADTTSAVADTMDVDHQGSAQKKITPTFL
jgi:hypothetical protein